MIVAHLNPQLLGSRNPPTSASQAARTTGTCHHLWLLVLIFILVEIGSYSIVQVGLKLLASGDHPTLASQLFWGKKICRLY